MKSTWRVRVNLVFFVLGSLLLSYLMANQVLSILQDRFSVYALFPDAGGVFTNQEVTYRGVQVGNVGTMEVVPQGVRIELKIREGVEIPADDVEARVMFKSAVGEQFVDLLPQSTGSPFLADRDVIPLDRTDIPVSTQELLSTLEAVLRGVPPEALEGAIDALGEGLEGRGRDLATIIESSADLAELFARRAPQVRRILANGTEVGGAFLASRRDFETAIEQLVTVADTLDDGTGDLRQLLIGANLMSDEALALIRDERKNLHAVLHDLAAINSLQAEHADDIARLFEDLPRGLAAVVNAFEPATGLIRFGSIQQTQSPGCSYGTERRRPEDRSDRLPPRAARCGSAGSSQTTARARGGASGAPDAGTLLEALSDATPKLPPRMSDWSWTLLYLHALDPGR